MVDTIALNKQLVGTWGVALAQLENALRAYYEQHQASGCTCDPCKNAGLH